MIDVPNMNMLKLKRAIAFLTDRIGNENFALLLMAIANLLWPVSFVYVSQHHFSPLQTNLARGAAICFKHILLCRFLGIPLDFKSSRDLKYLLVRNTLIGLHQVVCTAMYFVLSFPLINSITITGPLFVFLIDYYVNGVTINRLQAIGIAVGFAGILVNINGDFLMTLIDPAFETTSSFEHYTVTDAGLKILFSFVAVLTNIVWGYAIVVQKKISHVPGIKNSYFLGIEFVVTSGTALSFGGIEPVPMSSFLAACLCSGLIMSACQIMFMSALNLSRNAGKLTMLILLYGVSSYCISFFKYGERVNPLCLLGLALMGYGLHKTIFSKQP